MVAKNKRYALNWLCIVLVIASLIFLHGRTFLSTLLRNLAIHEVFVSLYQHGNGNKHSLLKLPVVASSETELLSSWELSRHDRTAFWLAFLMYSRNEAEQANKWWGEVAESTDYFSAWSQYFRQIDRNSDAKQWDLVSVEFDPKWGDGWYHIGNALAREQRWMESLRSYQNAQNGNLEEVGQSDLTMRMALWYQSAEGFVDLEKSLQLINSALAQDNFRESALQAEAYYKRGELLLRKGGYNAEEVRQDFTNALQITPYHRWARLRLAVVGYDIDQDATHAVAEIQRALINWPDDSSKIWPYIYLGEIYEQEQDYENALSAYTEALMYSSDNPMILDRLKRIPSH